MSEESGFEPTENVDTAARKRYSFTPAFAQHAIVLGDNKTKETVMVNLSQFSPEVTFYLTCEGIRRIATRKVGKDSTLTSWAETIAKIASLEANDVKGLFHENKIGKLLRKKAWTCYFDEIELQALANILHSNGLIASDSVQLAYEFIHGFDRETQETYKNNRKFRLLVAELTPDE